MLVNDRPGLGCAATQAGFSLIQLLAAIAVLGTLLTIAIPGYSIFVERARNSRAIGQVAEIDIAINEYALSHVAQLPADLADIGFAGAVDPWGTAIAYVNFSLGGSPRVDEYGEPVNTAYDLYSAGPDRVSALSLNAGESQDDVLLASDGGFVGVVADYRELD